jgi:ATP-dependent RNA helicase DDX54/DBP10
MAFFSIKQAEKDACLLSLLRDVIKVPLGQNQNEEADRKKTKVKQSDQLTASHQTLIFAATKHHVEYLLNLLNFAGYAVSHIYGSLDQAARTYQMDQFRRGITNILVVTDVAARGIDIPVLENVVNYDFPQGARVFVHRVGRTARAGRRGWAWSFVTNSELPYLLDLQLFLGRPLVNDVDGDTLHVYTESLVLGTFQRERIDEDVEYVRSLDDVHHSLPTLREVMRRGHSMYERSKGKASPQSYKRAKEMMKDPKWLLSCSHSGIHPVILRNSGTHDKREQEEARKNLLRVVNGFTPSETVFEVGSKGNSETAALMKERRKALQKSAQRAVSSGITVHEGHGVAKSKSKVVEMADEDDIVVSPLVSTPEFRD